MSDLFPLRFLRCAAEGRVAVDFNNLITELKRLRHLSDYSDEMIDNAKSAKAIHTSKEIITILKTHI